MKREMIGDPKDTKKGFMLNSSDAQSVEDPHIELNTKILFNYRNVIEVDVGQAHTKAMLVPDTS